MPTDSADLFGVNLDWFTAGGAIFGPMVAILLGIFVFRLQQQAQLAHDRYLASGLARLIGTLSKLLSIHLLNYQIATYLIRSAKHYDSGHWMAPTPDELPQLLGLDVDSLPIEEPLPVIELLGDNVVLDWVMLAASDVTLEAKELDFQVRRPLAAYYRSGNPSPSGDEIATALIEVLEVWNSKVSVHFALVDRLNDLARHLSQKRPWTTGGYQVVSQRPEVTEIRETMLTQFADAKKKGEEAKEKLKQPPSALT